MNLMQIVFQQLWGSTHRGPIDPAVDFQYYSIHVEVTMMETAVASRAAATPASSTVHQKEGNF